VSGHKVLVTGATGLVGGNLARLLVQEKGEAVKALVRASSSTLALDGLDVERVGGDITEPDSLARAVKGCDRVYHAAALVSNWNGYLEAMWRVNVQGTQNVLEAAMNAGVARLVHVSTNAALGMGRRDRPADETEPWAYEPFGSAYSLTKRRAHELATAYARRGLDVRIGCPTYMFGAWDVKPTSGTMILEAARGRTLLYPTGGNNIVDVLDVCRGLILAGEKGRRGEAYLLCNREGNLTYREIFNLIADTVGGRRPLAPLPRRAASAAGRVIDVWARLAGKAPEVNRAALSSSYRFQYYTPRKAIEELGMPQSPVAEAIRRAFEWFREHGYAGRARYGFAKARR